ncbi:hypothetical protein GW17_00057470 [Ensete ventricosum]|nr:hypothetical protein GW17_00057470 [Ensete ventricosum]
MRGSKRWWWILWRVSQSIFLSSARRDDESSPKREWQLTRAGVAPRCERNASSSCRQVSVPWRFAVALHVSRGHKCQSRRRRWFLGDPNRHKWLHNEHKPALLARGSSDEIAR